MGLCRIAEPLSRVCAVTSATLVSKAICVFKLNQSNTVINSVITLCHCGYASHVQNRHGTTGSMNGKYNQIYFMIKNS